MHPKIHFEQIPVERVKEISQVDPRMVDDSGDGEPLNNSLTADLAIRRDVTTIRPWQEIAREVAHEPDSVRMVSLCRELNAALLAEEQRRNPQLDLPSEREGNLMPVSISPGTTQSS
jgi:hypothetical protein